MVSDKDLSLHSYDYDLPAELIAQVPSSIRDESRLLVVDCPRDRLNDRKFSDVPSLFSNNDLLVVNDTKVFPARLIGRKQTGGMVELFLLGYPLETPLGYPDQGTGFKSVEADVLIKSSKSCGVGTRIYFGEELHAKVTERTADGKVRAVLHHRGQLDAVLGRYGVMPLPPYIKRESGENGEDRQRYQTVYAREPGAVAAPTAGLHFTEELFASIDRAGVRVASVTLHVGYGTFAPVRDEDIRRHQIHSEFVEVSSETASLINETRQKGGAVWCVGTTTARSLEFAATEDGMVVPVKAACNLYIYPGYRFRVVRNLITNFHLPRSSLLFLVSALAGRERMLAAYRHAIAEKYRFFSYGDAMAIITDRGVCR